MAPKSGSRTTTSNAWRPPSNDGGTVSPDRAARWQGQAAGGGSPSASEGRAARGQRGPGALGASRSSARSPGASRKAAPPEAEELEGEVDQDFAEEWNFLAKPEPLVNGKLSQAYKRGPTPGMSNPPQNPQVKMELMLMLQKHGTPAKKAYTKRTWEPGHLNSPRDVGLSQDSLGSTMSSFRSSMRSTAGSMRLTASAQAPKGLSGGRRNSLSSTARPAGDESSKKMNPFLEESIFVQKKPAKEFFELRLNKETLHLRSRDLGDQLSNKTRDHIVTCMQDHNSAVRKVKAKMVPFTNELSRTRDAENLLYSSGLTSPPAAYTRLGAAAGRSSGSSLNKTGSSVVGKGKQVPEVEENPHPLAKMGDFFKEVEGVMDSSPELRVHKHKSRGLLKGLKKWASTTF